MKLKWTIAQRRDGQCVIRHSSGDAGDVEVTAASREEALAKMLDELRYRLEFCACVGDRYGDLQIELVETP